MTVRDGPRLALGLVGALAALKLLLHLSTTGTFGYGFFVDELYFLACGEHLDWGYVDLPPLFPALTALVRWLLGDSLFAVRLVPTLAGAALVLLTAGLARDLGGGRFAQGLAALAVVTAPIYLALHGLHTMNALEPLLWMGCAWVVVRIQNGASPRLWLVFGLLAGLGLLNKHSMAFFGAGIVAGLVVTPARRAFLSPWLYLGGLLTFLIFLPNLVWDVAHGFPHLELLANIRADGRDVPLSLLQFLGEQALMMLPTALPLWLAGLVFFLADAEGRRHRALGIAYLTILALLLLVARRVYYLAPAYPMLLAGGGVALERWTTHRAKALRPAYVALLVATAVLLAPLALPCLPPETYVRYARALGIDQPRLETHRLGPLPQLFADRFGWREMAEVVAGAYRRLPPQERARAAVFGQNYGQAGAIDLFGPKLGLPKALSGHLTYFYWGPRDATGDVMIVMDDDRETLEGLFEEVELAGRVEHTYSMPYEHFDVFVCRRMKVPLRELWPRLKRFR